MFRYFGENSLVCLFSVGLTHGSKSCKIQAELLSKLRKAKEGVMFAYWDS